MKTKIKKIPYTEPVSRCEFGYENLCGGYTDLNGVCLKCGNQNNLETHYRIEGKIWERVTTTNHGETTYSYNPESADYETDGHVTRLVNAISRLVGKKISIGWGHYGYGTKSGISPIGKYKTEQI